MKYTGKLVYVLFSVWVLMITSGCGTQNSDMTAVKEKFRVTDLSKGNSFKNDTLLYLNHLREVAGLRPLENNTLLEASASSHAHYLTENNLYTHTEDVNDPSYSGVTPYRRAIQKGYDGERILENIYAGDVSGSEAVDILFSDIYHRFAFLDFDINEIGLAAVTSPAYKYGTVHTFEMGTHKSMEKNSSNPALVVWPSAGNAHVMPVFYEEEPDPLPECSVSGYPVSVAFDPAKSDGMQIDSFMLYDENDLPVKDLLLLDRQNDPSHRLGKNQFALMPLKRLDWGKRYRAELVYRDKEMHLMTKSWEFFTQKPEGNLFEVKEEQSAFVVKSGQTNFFYLVPHDCNDRFESYTYHYSSTLKIREKMIDHNTIKLYAEGKGYIKIVPDNGRSFLVRVI